MTELRGMTLKQFKDTIEEMRNTVPFTDEETKIVNVNQPETMCPSQIQLFFEKNDIKITMTKGVELNENRYPY